MQVAKGLDYLQLALQSRPTPPEEAPKSPTKGRGFKALLRVSNKFKTPQGSPRTPAATTAGAGGASQLAGASTVAVAVLRVACEGQLPPHQQIPLGECFVRLSLLSPTFPWPFAR